MRVDYCLPIPFANKYFATRSGKIFSTKIGDFMSQADNGNGYKSVEILNDGAKKHKRYYVHRLIMLTFNPIENFNKLEVNHINGIKSDNRLKNLCWVTKRENMIHACSELGVNNGAKNSQTWVTDEDIDVMLDMRENGVPLVDIASLYGYFNGCGITRILKGERWKYRKLNR